MPVTSAAGSAGATPLATDDRAALASTRPDTTWPWAPSTVTVVPSCRSRVAVRVPTMHGTPNSRATIAAWHVMPPVSVTSAAARRMVGSQSGLVIWATRISPSSKSVALVGGFQHAHLARRHSGCRGQSTGQHCVLLGGRRRRMTQRRDRPGLHQIRLTVRDRPFGVLRAAVVPLGRDGEFGNASQLGVVEHPGIGLLVVEVDGLVVTIGTADDLEGLVPDVGRQDIWRVSLETM